MQASPSNLKFERELKEANGSPELICRRNMVLPRDKWGNAVVRRAKIC